MKLTNKILLVFLILLVLLVTAYKIVFDCKVELIPNPFEDKTSYITKYFPATGHALNQIELKGRFIVYFIKKDSAGVIMEGPDNLINHYLTIKQEGNKLSINSKIDFSKYSHFIRIYCYTNMLRSVKASGGAIIYTERFTGDSLAVAVEDSSIVKANYCKYLNTRIIGKEKSMVMMERTKNATIHLYDQSELLLTLDGGEVNGMIEKNTDLGLGGMVKKNNVERVKSNSKQRGELK